MNWDAIGAIGQVVSALAFVLAIVQIRHMRSDARRAIGQERADRNVQINIASATNERLATLRAKANEVLLAGEPPRHPFMSAAPAQLGVTSAEAFMLYTEQMSRWVGLNQSIAYMSELPPGERTQFDRVNGAGFREPLFQFWYGLTKSMLNPDTVRYVDDLMAQVGNVQSAPAPTEAVQSG